jgi:hypothetical protein
MKVFSNSLKYNNIKYINRNIRQGTRVYLSSNSIIDKSILTRVNKTIDNKTGVRKLSIQSRLLNFFNNNSNYVDHGV